MEQLLELLKTETIQTLILVCCLLLEGAAIKHAGIFEKIPNKAVPFILMVTSIIVCIIYCGNGTDVGTIVNAVLSAVSATGLHQTGKITMNILPTLLTNFRSELNAPEAGDIDEVKETSDTAKNMAESIIEAEKIVSGTVDQIKTSISEEKETGASNLEDK